MIVYVPDELVAGYRAAAAEYEAKSDDADVKDFERLRDSLDEAAGSVADAVADSPVVYVYVVDDTDGDVVVFEREEDAARFAAALGETARDLPIMRAAAAAELIAEAEGDDVHVCSPNPIECPVCHGLAAEAR